MSNPFEKLERHLKEIYDELSEQQKIAAASQIIPRLLEHARDGGSFRHLIYTRLGFSTAAYTPLCLCGGLEFSNEVVAPRVAKEDVQHAIDHLGELAGRAPMEPSGVKREDGSEILKPSEERTALFTTLRALQSLADAASAQQEVIDRQREALRAIATERHDANI